MNTKYFLFSVVFIMREKNLQFLLKQNTYGFPEFQELLLFPSSPVSGLYLTITCAIKSETYSVHFIKQIQVKMNTFIFTEMMIFSLWDY